MNRRDFIRGAGAAVAALAVLGPREAAALLECQDYPQRSMRRCEAGISSSVLQVTANSVGGQHQQNWCWAACIEMVFNYYGYVVPQERIVQETFGRTVDVPAEPGTVMSLLNRNWVDDQGRRFRTRGEYAAMDVYSATRDLSEDRPLIIGALNHAMVLTALSYYCYWDGYTWTQCGIDTAIVRDPWPGRDRRALTNQEWGNIMFLARVYVDRA